MRKWRNMASPALIISAETGAARGAGDGTIFWANPRVSCLSNSLAAAVCKRLRSQVHLAIVFPPASPLQST